jgi:hypothetical protein
MAEYALILALSRGTHWVDGVLRGVADDPALRWGAGIALVLVAFWVLKPNR